MRAPTALVLALSACAPFPAIDSPLTPADRAAGFPVLAPIEPVIAAAQAPGEITAADIATTDARLQALRNRAAALRGPVLTRAEQAALQGG